MPQGIKNICIDTKYQHNIENLQKERALTREVVQGIYERFMSEENCNHMQNALEALENYRYVPHGYSIPAGRYIRYIDTTSHFNMPLKLGGFVTGDNGYSVVFKSASETQRIVRLNKRHCVLFAYITDQEKLRLALDE